VFRGATTETRAAPEEGASAGGTLVAALMAPARRASLISRSAAEGAGRRPPAMLSAAERGENISGVMERQSEAGSGSGGRHDPTKAGDAPQGAGYTRWGLWFGITPPLPTRRSVLISSRRVSCPVHHAVAPTVHSPDLIPPARIPGKWARSEQRISRSVGAGWRPARPQKKKHGLSLAARR